MKNNNNKRQKFENITLQCYTRNFNDGLTDLCKVSEELDTIINDKKIDEVSARKLITEDFLNNLPIFGDKNTQFNSLTCAFNKINRKFSSFHSIGWNIKTDRETGETSYVFFYTIMSYRKKQEVFNYLIDLGWEESTR